ncbi:hypothetical protein DNL40_14715 [Xylanimonas oleitrophica]|uniref:Uncharacterized protein n=1 Tax=Xylanimonas oleitrophica TaxID=2607479 RepID=A0A2W5WKY9_9MICO|nr:histidine kinase [Xylanimonas oleitrophica]PZR51860.1 hypothetical protein DNL40_14715 [Xylanimonas oleitrophica]
MSAPQAAALHQRDFTGRILAASLVVRLMAILVSLLGLVGQTMTMPVLMCILVLSVTSLSVLLSPQVTGFVRRHPLAFVLDVLVALAVVYVVGVESPLVLVTLSTALVVGMLFDRRTAALCGVVLVAGYVLVSLYNPAQTRGFMLELGVPALYVGLIAVGGAVRGAHEAQLVAARQAAEAQLAAAAADERARLAREMHDSLGKTLHGIALGADALPRLVEQDPATASTYARDLSLGAHQAADEARRLLVRMRADQPDRPFAEVLAERCAAWEEAHGIPCRLTVTGVVDLATACRYEVLAIVGEALENVARHADAQQVEVALTGLAGGRVRVGVRDDGRGFLPRPDGGSPEGHFGLTGMAERAREAGMRLSVSSAPGHGTTVSVESVDPDDDRSARPETREAADA